MSYTPFKKTTIDIKLSAICISELLSYTGYNIRRNEFHTETIDGHKVNECNFNPYIINIKGEREYYQRELVWDLNDKQLLIDSIYNNIDIGKFVIRKYSFSYIKSELEKGNTEVAFYDVIDGKQRLNALIEFGNGKFKDSAGHYYNELDEVSKRKFAQYTKLSYSCLGETATDKDAIDTFLYVNFTGKQMSQDHIDFVKTINVK